MAMTRIDDNDLDKVVGGFREENETLPTFGKSIVCPSCHASDAKSFAIGALYNPKIGSVEYHCGCGCQFVCYDDKVYLRKDWDALCKKKGIDYGF